MREFVYIIKPIRERLMETMTPSDEEIMNEHFDYLKDLLGKEQLILAGPCLDGAMGIVVFLAESEEEARKIMENDPSVQQGLMQSELHPYRVSLIKK
jgi:uncharacterized protein